MDRFIFPEWTEKFKKLVGLLVVGGPIYLIALIAFGVSDEAIRIGYQPTQPVPYSHALHAGELGIDCRYCHTAVERSAFASVPPAQTCMNCHGLVHPDSENLTPIRRAVATLPADGIQHLYVEGSSPPVPAWVAENFSKLPDADQAELVKLMEKRQNALNARLYDARATPDAKTGEWQVEVEPPLAWTKVYDLPDYVYFNHSAHVTRGVGCESCHGRVDRMPVVYQATPLTMQWCLQCHRNPERHLRDPALVTVMGYQPDGDPVENGRALRVKHNINPPTNCSTCHR